MITRDNYEIYFIDFLEGNLSQEERENVVNFLDHNPDLREELNLLDLSVLNIEPEIQTSDFSFLKKEQAINSENEDDFFIGKLEGDLTSEEEKMLMLYLKDNPSKQKVFESFQQTKLAPIVELFSGKSELKKQPKKTLFYTLSLLSGAAAVIFAIVVFNFNSDTTIYEASILKNNWELKAPIIQPKIEILEITPPKKLLARVLPLTDTKVNKVKPEPREKNTLVKENVSGLNDIQSQSSKDLASFTPVTIPVRKVNPTNNKFTPMEFAQEKAKEFVQEKTGEEVENGNELLAFASTKIKENVIPKFIDVETKEIDNQKYRTISIGKKFSIKHKIKN